MQDCSLWVERMMLFLFLSMFSPFFFLFSLLIIIPKISIDRRKIVCRGEGHRSWVSFLSFLNETDENEEKEKTKRGGSLSFSLASVGQDGYLCLWKGSLDDEGRPRSRTVSGLMIKHLPDFSCPLSILTPIKNRLSKTRKSWLYKGSKARKQCGVALDYLPKISTRNKASRFVSFGCWR